MQGILGCPLGRTCTHHFVRGTNCHLSVPHADWAHINYLNGQLVPNHLVLHVHICCIALGTNLILSQAWMVFCNYHLSYFHLERPTNQQGRERDQEMCKTLVHKGQSSFIKSRKKKIKNKHF